MTTEQAVHITKITNRDTENNLYLFNSYKNARKHRKIEKKQSVRCVKVRIENI